MMTTLFSVSFTSCIDNEVSPLVEAIYEAQADLIAAQANVQNAEAALLLAQAANEEANAALLEAQATAAVSIAQGQLAVLLANAGLTDAQAAAVLSAAEGDLAQALADAGLTEAQAAQILADIADQEADAEYTAAVREQQLLALAAQTSLDVANLQNELALAQVTFQTQMAAAIAAMEAAGAQLAVGYAWDYAMAMQHANGLMQDLLEAQADLASAQLMQNGNVSWEFYLAQMQGNVATAMAAKANLETAIADLEAYIADPSTPEAIISDLKAQNVAYHEAMDAKEIEMQVQYNKIMELYEQDGVRDELVSRTWDSLNEHNDAVNDKNDRLDWIEVAEGDIEDWELAISNYPAALAAKQLAVTNATTAKNAAQTAFNTASTAQATANTAQMAADAALTTLENELATLYAALQTAANTLASEQALYNAGIGAATTANTNAINAITTAGANLAAAQANYELWKGRFEGNVGVDNVTNGGYYWVDPTSPSTVLGDTVLGNHTNANGVASTSYVRVESWTYNDIAPAGAGPEDTYTPLTIGATQQATLGAGQLPIAGNGAITQGEYVTTYPVLGYTLAFYVEVGMDDVVYSNLTEMNNAIAALGDEDIFDVAPVLGATALVGADAYTNLWNAQLAQLGTQDYLDNFGDDLAAAQDAYDYWKNLYENELDLLNAAQAALAAANTTLAAANATLATATTNLATATTNLNNANAALTTFLATDIDDYQDLIDAALLNIAAWNQQIAAIQPIIDAKYAVVAGLLGELTAAGVVYTFEVETNGTGTLVVTNYGVLSSLYPDIHAQIIAEWQVYWTMEQELEALQNAHDLNIDLISAYGWWSDDLDDLANMLAGLQNQLVNAVYDIEVAEQALAAAQVEEAADEAYISYLEAVIDTIEQRHANTLAIAAKYKALMDAALAS